MAANKAGLRITQLSKEYKGAKEQHLQSNDASLLKRAAVDLIKEVDRVLEKTQDSRVIARAERLKNEIGQEVFGIDREKLLADMEVRRAAAALAAAVPAKTKGIDATFLNSFTASLEEVVQLANGYGELKSAVIEAEDDGVTVTATWDGRYWSVTL